MFEDVPNIILNRRKVFKEHVQFPPHATVFVAFFHRDADIDTLALSATDAAAFHVAYQAVLHIHELHDVQHVFHNVP